MCHYVTEWPWMSYISPLGLSFFVCEVRDLDVSVNFNSRILIWLVVLKDRRAMQSHVCPAEVRRSHQKL